MKKAKNTLRKITLVALAAFLIIAGIPSQAFADQADSGFKMENARRSFMDEGKARVAANILYKCIKYSYNGGDGLNGSLEGDDITHANKVFKAWWDKGGESGGTGMNGGAWYEQKQEGKIDDGYISCNTTSGQSVFAIFAETLGIGISDILCKPDGTPGLFRNEWNPEKCEGINDPHKYFELNEDGWEDHLKNLYETSAKEHGWYDGRWSNINYYDDYVGYGMYLQEIAVGCGEAVDESTPHLPTQLAFLDDNGSIMWQYIPGDMSSYPVPNPRFHNGKRYSFADWGQDKTCNAIVGRANQMAISGVNENSDGNKMSVREKIWSLIEEGCKDAYTKQKETAEAIIASGDASESQVSQAEQAIKEFNSLTTFTQEVKNEGGEVGRECIDVEYLMKPTMDAYDPYESPEAVQDIASCTDQAGSLGWIVCPLVNGLAEAVTNIYDDLIVPFLRIDVGLLDGANSGGRNVFKTWQVFQQLANLVFVGILFVVIFSQTTGYGIGNYGIKKILPKLIVGAILINLSYIICAIVVDVSNIAGYGIGSLFEGIGNMVGQSVSEIQVKPGATGVTLQVISGATVGIGIFSVIAAFLSNAAFLGWGGIAIILPVLMALMTMFLGILFIFLILSLRQALAVMLVVVSPVAFACYILPNTKSIFSKWLKGFEGILLTFPIASALIYGGQSIGKILINSGGTSSTTTTGLMFSAAVVSIAPVFFIPSLVRSSMNGITQLGAAINGISGLKNKIKGGTRNSLANSEYGRANELMRNEMKRQAMLKQIGKRQERLEGKSKRSPYEEREYRRNAAILASDEENENRAEVSGWMREFKKKNPNELLDMFSDDDKITTKKGGEQALDFNKIQAAMANLKGSDRIKAYNALSKQDAFKTAMKDNESRQKMAQIMAAGGTEVEKGIADILGGGKAKDGDYSFKNLAQGGALSEYFKERGVGIADTITKHDMQQIDDGSGHVIFDMGNYLEGEQLGAIIAKTGSMDGETQTAAIDMLTNEGKDGSEGRVLATNSTKVVEGLKTLRADQLTGISMKATDDMNGLLKQRGGVVGALDPNVLNTIQQDTTGQYTGRMNNSLRRLIGQDTTTTPQTKAPDPGDNKVTY